MRPLRLFLHGSVRETVARCLLALQSDAHRFVGCRAMDIQKRLEEFVVRLSNIDWSRIPLIDRELTIYDVVIAFIGLYLAWRALVVSNRSYKQQKEATITPSIIPLRVLFFDYDLSFHFIMFAPFESNKLSSVSITTFQFPLDFKIENLKDFSVDDVGVYLKLNAKFYRGKDSGVKIQASTEFLGILLPYKVW